MRNSIWASLTAAALAFVLGGPLPADADPSVQQVYQAASSGRLGEAQQMMDQVLRDHPSSSKAHYVQSELYAREGKAASARAELARAEQLDPGLTKENPRSVAELRSQLGLDARAGQSGAYAPHSPPVRWGLILIVALAIGVCLMLFRRRTTYVQYPNTVGPVPPAGTYGSGGYGPGPMGGGLGSTIAGGLAGGLAGGVGIAAGEELAHHVLDGPHSGAAPPPADDSGATGANSDMGGANFGVDDPGSWNDDSGASWDDGSSGGDGGGGGDWT